MPSFRENRIALLHAYDDEVNDEEFVLFYDANTSKILDLPYWNYENFDLDNLSNDECKAEFRFLKDDIYTLYEVMQFPEEMSVPQLSMISNLATNLVFDNWGQLH